MNLHPSRPAIRRKAIVPAAVLALSAVIGLSGCVATTTTSEATQAPLTKSDVELVIVIQSTTNEYNQQMAEGGKAYAASLGLPLKVIETNGDSQQQLAQIQATIAATTKKVVMTVLPIDAADVPAVVKAVASSGGYITTQWNKPADYQPWDVGPNYVAHLTYDGYSAGYWTGKALFESMGGKGGIIALNGPLGNPVPAQRTAGLEKALAEYPGITLLGSENVPNFDQQTAFTDAQTLYTKYGTQINGVWAASDSLALGAYSALDQVGKASTVKFSGMDATQQALKLMNEGDSYVATYTADGYYDGAIGLAMAYEAATGGLNVSDLTHDQRDGNYSQVGVDKTNVSQFLAPPSQDKIMTEINKGLFDRLLGPEQK